MSATWVLYFHQLSAMKSRRSDILEFSTWLDANEVCLNGFALSNSENAAGIGAIANQDLEIGHCLFRLPKRLCVLQSESAIGKVISEWGVLLSSWTALALTIAYESMKIESRWSGYLAFLPKAEQKLLNLPIQWGDKELRNLEGTGLCSRAGKQRAYVYYQRHITPFILSHPDLFPHGLDFHQFIHCGALVSAYSFTLKNEEVAMMPVADALNADGREASNARLQQLDDEQGWEMVVTRPVEKGEELLNFYGSFAESESLLRYGYISRTDTPGTAITARELHQALERKGSRSSIHRARLTIALKSSIFVKAAPCSAEPFLDSGKVLPLSNLRKIYKKMDRFALMPILILVIEERIELLKQHNNNESALHTMHTDGDCTSARTETALQLREVDLPRLENAARSLLSFKSEYR